MRSILIFCLLAAPLGPAASAQSILVQPYLQPGPLPDDRPADSKLLIWFTDQILARYTVAFGRIGEPAQYLQPRPELISVAPGKACLKYTALLSPLPLDSKVHYRVTHATEIIATNSFQTRHSRARSLRFAALGDIAQGKPASKTMAFQIQQAAPEIVLVLGDIVYPRGRISEYFDHFWNVYDNVLQPGPNTGAPLMHSIPFYAILGNHDVLASDLEKVPDGMAAFYFFSPPFRTFPQIRSATPLQGALPTLAQFRRSAGRSYPGLCFYSFDNGPAHFLCLDANPYTRPDDAALCGWIADDLAKSRARWKIVCFHEAAFHVSSKHVAEQKMRLFSPLFEAGGVDLVFSGHVHNYQRSKPLHFRPSAIQADKTFEKVTGIFQVDRAFDGITNTQPNGVIYIVSGGGGASLYNPTFTDRPSAWRGDPSAPAGGFTTKVVANRHSVSIVDVNPTQLELRQIDELGHVIDSIQVTKP